MPGYIIFDEKRAGIKAGKRCKLRSFLGLKDDSKLGKTGLSFDSEITLIFKRAYHSPYDGTYEYEFISEEGKSFRFSFEEGDSEILKKLEAFIEL